MKRNRWSWLCLVAIVLCTTAWAVVPAPSRVIADRMVHVFNKKGHGVGTLLGPNRVLTAQHVYSGTPTYSYGQEVRLKTFVAPDTVILEFKTPHVGVEELRLGRPKLGSAVIVTMEIKGQAHRRLAIPVTIVGLEETPWGYAFRGHRPVPGQSGSPVVQNGKIVGVVSMLGAGLGGYFSPVIEAK